MRVATVPTEISYYSAINALEKIVAKATADDIARFSQWDVDRLERLVAVVKSFINNA